MGIVRFIVLSVVVASFVSVSADSAFAQGRRANKNSNASSSTSEPTRIPEVMREKSSRDGLKVGAFVDVEARIANKDTLEDRGISLNDAALYFDKQFNYASALVDLPFESVGFPGSFAFARGKAQAYLQIERGAWGIRAGQYDSIFGIEQNDSKDRLIADAGALNTYVTPNTATGALVSYQIERITIRGQLANPNGQGLLGTSNPEFGGQLRFDAGDGAFGAFGISVNESKNSPTTNKTNMLINLMGGVNVEKLRFDAELDFVKSENTDKTGMALGLFAGYAASTEVTIAGRFEHMKEVFVTTGGAGGLLDIFQFSAGPSYRLEDGITLRGDFSLMNLKSSGGGGVDETIFGVTASVVAVF